MEIEYYGANCFCIKTKKSSVVVDDDLNKHGLKNVAKKDDAVFYTQKQLVSEEVVQKARLVIDSAGEFEVGDVSVKALQTRGHMDESGVETATVYQFLYSNTTVTVLGHLHPDLADDVLEMAGGTDVLIVPVGGNGYTLDAVGATSAIKKIEPDVVLPSHYNAKGLSFEVPVAPLEDFLKTSGLQADEPQDSYKVDKPNQELSTQTHVVVLNIKKT